MKTFDISSPGIADAFKNRKRRPFRVTLPGSEDGAKVYERFVSVTSSTIELVETMVEHGNYSDRMEYISVEKFAEIVGIHP